MRRLGLFPLALAIAGALPTPGLAKGLDDTPDSDKERAPAPEGVEPVIELDKSDPTYVSGLNANRVVRDCLVGIAMRKRGLVEKHYLSPKTVDDGRN